MTETLNLPVVSLDSGRHLGECLGYVFDLSKKAVAVQVRSKKLFQKPKVISLADISQVGHDAILANSEKSLAKPKKASEIARAIEERLMILHASVLTEEGKELGRVSEVVIECGSGKIDSILLSQGLVKDITHGPIEIPGDQIKKIGVDHIIISPPEEKKTKKKPVESGLLLKGLEKAAITAGRLSGQAKRNLTRKRGKQNG